MKTICWFTLLMVMVATQALAQIPATVGWYEIPGAKITAVADPNLNNLATCQADPTQCSGLINMIRAWSGADFDQNGNRLLIWGGGHADYGGNEVYAFNLNTLTTTRLSNATFPTNGAGARIQADGQIVSLHTYDSMAYHAGANRLIQFNGGGSYPSALQFNDLWEFNPAAGSAPWWNRRIFNGIWGASEGIEAAYDPNRQLVFFHDYATNGFFSYDYASNTATRLATHSRAAYQYTNFVDTKRKRYFEVGMGTMYWVDIAAGSAYALNALTTTNQPALLGTTWPGITYDPSADRYVAWNGGTTVYVLDPNTNAWSSVTPNCYNLSGTQVTCTVPSARVANGTFGRWNYSITSGVFVLQNEAYQNAFVLRMNAGSGTNSDFTTRCAAAGVTKCWGFDNTTTDIVISGVNQNTYAGAATTPSLDTTIKASGAGSLKFTLPANTTGANMAGQWTKLTAPYNLLGSSFAAGSTFYVQFRQLFSPEMMTNTTFWDSSWKQMALYQNNVACAAMELTTVHKNFSSYPNDFPVMYTDCGDPSQFNPTIGGFIYLQQGADPVPTGAGYNCRYGSVNPTNCFIYPVNKWITFYYRIVIGTWNGSRFANTQVDAWVSVDGQPYTQWQNITMNLSGNTSGDVINNITFLPYMTALSTSAPVTAATWIDELVISTQPIAVPSNVNPDSTPPAVPTGVIVR